MNGWLGADGGFFSISHLSSRRLFLDQPLLTQIDLEKWMDELKPFVISPSGEVAVNLWIGRDYSRYVIDPGKGIYIENHFRMHNDIRGELGLKPLPGTSDDYWPDVLGDLCTPTTGRNSVLICNGPVTSDQAENFDFTRAIIQSAARYPNVTFYATQRLEVPTPGLPNLVFTDDLFKERSDLPEISILSRSCRIIVGRKSGPHVWSQSRTNWLDSEKVFVSFTRTEIGAWNVHPDNPKVRAARIWREALTDDQAEIQLLEILSEHIGGIAKYPKSS